MHLSAFAEFRRRGYLPNDIVFHLHSQTRPHNYKEKISGYRSANRRRPASVRIWDYADLSRPAWLNAMDCYRLGLSSHVWKGVLSMRIIANGGQ